MSELDVTRTVERWARLRSRQRLLDEASWVGAVGLCAAAVVVLVTAVLPSLVTVALVLAVVAVIAVIVRAWLRSRHGSTPDAVASAVDDEAGTLGLLRTGMAVEQRRAVGGPVAREVVLEQSRAAVRALEAVGAPALQVPLGPILVGAGAFVTLFLALALFLVAPTVVSRSTGPEGPVGTAYTPEQVEALGETAAELGALGQQPGLAPEARALIDEARERVQAAMSASEDLRRAASELDRARSALQQLGSTPLRSSEALKNAQPEVLATGLDDALDRGDMALARTLGEEVLRRADGGVSDGEVRRLGQALAEEVDDPGAAGAAARAAGEALQAGAQGDALSALADLMAALGEPVRYEAGKETVDEALRAVDEARDEALERLDKATSEQHRQRSEEAPDGPPTEEGEGNTPAPVDLSRQGGEGSGGGGSAEGGDQDLREGGTPGAGDEPEVNTSGTRPAGARQEGPDAEGGRTLAGSGEAHEGSVDPMSEGGEGAGPGPQGGGEPVQGDGTMAAAVSGPGPVSEGVGEGAGTGAEGETGLIEVDPDTIASDWVEAQWDGAGETMGDLVRTADAGGRSGMAWGEVHARYADLAEASARREAVPLTRRAYVRRYFEAIRPTQETE